MYQFLLPASRVPLLVVCKSRTAAWKTIPWASITTEENDSTGSWISTSQMHPALYLVAPRWCWSTFRPTWRHWTGRGPNLPELYGSYLSGKLPWCFYCVYFSRLREALAGPKFTRWATSLAMVGASSDFGGKVGSVTAVWISRQNEPRMTIFGFTMYITQWEHSATNP